MKQEEKELLMKYLCMALPYGVYANLPNHHLVSQKYVIQDINIKNGWTTGLLDCAGRIQIYGAKVEDIKPYLRSMSSMTEEERFELEQIIGSDVEVRDDYFYFLSPSVKRLSYAEILAVFEWLLKHHFDFMGLIPKDLAIEVTKKNNPYKN